MYNTLIIIALMNGVVVEKPGSRGRRGRDRKWSEGGTEIVGGWLLGSC